MIYSLLFLQQSEYLWVKNKQHPHQCIYWTLPHHFNHRTKADSVWVPGSEADPADPGASPRPLGLLRWAHRRSRLFESHHTSHQWQAHGAPMGVWSLLSLRWSVPGKYCFILPLTLLPLEQLHQAARSRSAAHRKPHPAFTVRMWHRRKNRKLTGQQKDIQTWNRTSKNRTGSAHVSVFLDYPHKVPCVILRHAMVLFWHAQNGVLRVMKTTFTHISL